MRRFLKFDRLAPGRIFGAGLENVIVMYKDLRGFIKQVDEIGALRRINGADPKFELGGITEVAAGTAECPAIQFDHQGRHGAIIAKKYWDAGKPCPVAVVNGQDPALFIAGFEYLPDGQSEYDFAGSIKGAPIETIRGPITGLPLPAQAEIILE